jgi:hypothetical protein
MNLLPADLSIVNRKLPHSYRLLPFDAARRRSGAGGLRYAVTGALAFGFTLGLVVTYGLAHPPPQNGLSATMPFQLGWRSGCRAKCRLT